MNEIKQVNDTYFDKLVKEGEKAEQEKSAQLDQIK